MGDKEKAAREWANERCPGQDEGDIVWTMSKEDFLAGYEKGQADLRTEFNEIIKKLDDELLLWQNGTIRYVNARPHGVLTDE